MFEVYELIHKGVVKYVGKATTGQGRAQKHFCSSTNVNLRKLNYLRKYRDEIEIRITPIGLNEADAFAEEIRLIKFYGFLDDGGSLLNYTSGGEGVALSPEAKKKHRVAVKAAHARPEVKARRRIVFSDPKLIAKRAAAIRATYRTRPEFRAKVAAASKAAHARPDVQAKMSAAIKTAHARPEEKAKRSAALKAAHARPDTKTRYSAGIKAALAHPEVRAKISISLKAALARIKAERETRL